MFAEMLAFLMGEHYAGTLVTQASARLRRHHHAIVLEMFAFVDTQIREQKSAHFRGEI